MNLDQAKQTAGKPPTTPPAAGIAPTSLEFLDDGTPRSALYDDVYHSSDGGPDQARHVFLAGNDLPQRWRNRAVFTVLETGFGLGLNFLATWHAFHNDPKAAAALHFVSVEAHPLKGDELRRLYARWPEFGAMARELVLKWPPLLRGVHRLHLDGGRVTLTLILGDAAHWLPQLQLHADALYLDGFAPQKNPALWSPEVLSQVCKLAAADATLATWSVAGGVREILQQQGFVCDKRPGFGQKREMLMGRRTPAAPIPSAAEKKRHALVIGAGLAGTALCERLAARGWQITLIERHAGPAQEASGNPAGALRPILNLSDQSNARLSRASLLYALRHHSRVGEGSAGMRHARCGVLHVATTADKALQLQQVLQAVRYPADFARWIDAEEASELAGRPLKLGGIWLPQAGWADPASVCRANLLSAGAAVQTRYDCAVDRLQTCPDGWEALDAQGQVIAQGEIVLLANAAEVRGFEQTRALPLEAVRGQLSLIRAAQARERSLDIVVCGDGYVAPAPGGGFCTGASFHRDDNETQPRLEDHVANLARLESMLPGFAAGLNPAQLEGRVSWRCTTPDRMPIAGEMINSPGLHVLSGLGARGLVWAPLLAELMVSQLCQEVLPVETELAAAVSPQRFGTRS